MPSSSITAYAGSSTGYVRERDIRQRRYLPQLTVGAESANVIPVTISMTTFQEALNDYVVADEAIALECVLYAANGIESLAAAHHLGESGAGTEISSTDQARLIITTSAGGAATLEVTDVVGGSAATLYLKIQPLNVPGFPAYTAITFD